MLYEAHATVKDFDTNIYKWVDRSTVFWFGLTLFFRVVEFQVQQNLDPSIMSPYNIVDKYQRFASALAYGTNTAPNTRVSPDGMIITHMGLSLDVNKWRAALKSLVNRIGRKMDDLYYNKDSGLQVPDMIPDDWTNTNRYYSWTQNAQFLPDKLALLHHMLNDEELDLAQIGFDGKLELKSQVLWNFLDRAANLNSDLALLCFFANGPNTRVLEFVEHKIGNSEQPRTSFYDDHTNSI